MNQDQSVDLERYRLARRWLYETVWPLELADTWRTQAALDCGLPRDFGDRLQIRSIELPPVPMVGYTRDQNQVYVMGGSPAFQGAYTTAYGYGTVPNFMYQPPNVLEWDEMTPWIAKIAPTTLVNGADVRPDVKIIYLKEKRAVNYVGGMLMHKNGYLYVVCRGIFYKLDADLEVVDQIDLPLVPGEGSNLTIYNGLQVDAFGRIVAKCFAPVSQQSPPGLMVSIDPESLAIQNIQFVPWASARMACGSDGDGMVYLYIPNTETSCRWRVTEQSLEYDWSWTRPYRIPSTTQANGPVFMGTGIVFPDNSSPSPGNNTPMHMYAHPNEDPPSTLEPTNAVDTAHIGCNFWKVAGDPFVTNRVLAWVPSARKVACKLLSPDGRRLTNEWGVELGASACLSMVPDRGFVFTSDFVRGTPGRDHFVVLDLKDGRELARLPTPATEPSVGIIFPGMNNDVYMLSSEAGQNHGYLHRIYAS